jgi:hypothetical protein
MFYSPVAAPREYPSKTQTVYGARPTLSQRLKVLGGSVPLVAIESVHGIKSMVFMEQSITVDLGDDRSRGNG